MCVIQCLSALTRCPSHCSQAPACRLPIGCRLADNRQPSAHRRRLAAYWQPAGTAAISPQQQHFNETPTLVQPPSTHNRRQQASTQAQAVQQAADRLIVDGPRAQPLGRRPIGANEQPMDSLIPREPGQLSLCRVNCHNTPNNSRPTDCLTAGLNRTTSQQPVINSPHSGGSSMTSLPATAPPRRAATCNIASA
jgi:hypothetical protein